MKIKQLSSLLLLVLFSSCSIKYAPKPNLDKEAALEKRKESYEKYKLNFSGNLFKSPTFIQENEKYNKEGIKPNIKLSEGAYSEFKNGETLETIAGVFGGAGGFSLGYYIGKALTNKDPSTVLLIVGGLGIGAGAIFQIIAVNKYKQSVSIYNGYLQKELNLEDKDTTVRSRKIDNFITSISLWQMEF